MFSVRLKLELIRIHDKNASLAAVVSGYEPRGEILEKECDKKKLIEMASPQELRRSRVKVERRQCDNELLQQATEEVFDSAVREPGNPSRYYNRL